MNFWDKWRYRCMLNLFFGIKGLCVVLLMFVFKVFLMSFENKWKIDKVYLKYVCKMLF